ncbi:MAG TPA: CBS domain-containing protein, partial [Gammaproteobacteria bacterium]|nr:CBS domain-containing protein [Gammaproteobacteria bacterium]
MRALDVLSEAFLTNHPDDAARAIESLGERDAANVLSRVSLDAAAQALSRIAPHDAGRLLTELGAERAAAILNRLEVQDAAAVLRTLEPVEQTPLLAALDEDDAQPISLLLMYPEGTAGAYMDPRALCVPADITVDQAQQRVRVRYRRTLYYIYVVDRDKELIGVVNLRELFMAPKGAPLASVTRRTVARIKASARRNAIVMHPRWRELHTLPVVDDDGRYLGAIRYRTLRRLEVDSANESKRKHPLTVAAGFAGIYALGMHSLLSAAIGALAVNGAKREQPGAA